MTIKYIRQASDLHLDFDADAWKHLPRRHPLRLTRKSELNFLWTLPELPEDCETLLLLPGDLWDENKAFVRRFGDSDSWLERLSRRFAAIAIVLGNHDMWGLTLNGSHDKARESIAKLGLTNVHVLENSIVIIDNVKVLGGTLWTDMHKEHPLVQLAAPDLHKNDYTHIRVKTPQGVYKKLWARDICAVHQRTRQFIFQNARRDYPEQHVIVMTHHAPSFQSIDEKFHTASDYPMNYLYFSDLDYYLFDDEVEADLWVHGHTHKKQDYVIDRTRVICNPRGYYGTEEHYLDAETHELVYKTGFDPYLRLEVAHLRIPRPPEGELPSEVPILEE